MEITLDMLPDQRWHGVLSIEGNQWDSAVAPRPGCVVRDLLNAFQLSYGNPGVQQMTLTINEW